VLFGVGLAESASMKRVGISTSKVINSKQHVMKNKYYLSNLNADTTTRNKILDNTGKPCRNNK
jgi:hypothetical protein